MTVPLRTASLVAGLLAVRVTSASAQLGATYCVEPADGELAVIDVDYVVRHYERLSKLLDQVRKRIVPDENLPGEDARRPTQPALKLDEKRLEDWSPHGIDGHRPQRPQLAELPTGPRLPSHADRHDKTSVEWGTDSLAGRAVGPPGILRRAA